MEDKKWYTDLLRIPQHILRNIEYFFAKRWLDKNFGVREYWGDDIYRLLLNNEKKG